jgi:hypothetical protein
MRQDPESVRRTDDPFANTIRMTIAFCDHFGIDISPFREQELESQGQTSDEDYVSEWLNNV